MSQKIIDAHIHGFPNRLFDAIWRYFEKNYWKIDNKLYFDEIPAFLTSKGVDFFTILNYAHKSDISRELNTWTHMMGRKFVNSIPFGTIHIKDSYFDKEVVRILSPDQLNLHGIKLQLMVTDFDPAEKALDFMYEQLIKYRKILVLHVGTGPVTDMLINKKLNLSTHVGINKLIPVLESFPKLKLQIPHLGCMETNKFFDLVGDYDQIYFDSSMALEFLFGNSNFADQVDLSLDRLIELQDKIMFGSDFPNIPHSYFFPLNAVKTLPITSKIKEKIFFKNAEKFFHLQNNSIH
ncbi:hypothetical protein ES708_01620 [subsurface metagenome]